MPVFPCKDLSVAWPIVVTLLSMDRLNNNLNYRVVAVH
jgi:hypothetical protein